MSWACPRTEFQIRLVHDNSSRGMYQHSRCPSQVVAVYSVCVDSGALLELLEVERRTARMRVEIRSGCGIPVSNCQMHRGEAESRFLESVVPRVMRASSVPGMRLSLLDVKLRRPRAES